MTQGLQPRLCPSTQPAEEGGVEPPGVTLASLSRGGGPHGPHLPKRKVKESNPQPLSWHGFLDRLGTIPRYPPRLPDKDSNLIPGVQSPVSYRLDDQALQLGYHPSLVFTAMLRTLARVVGIEPTPRGLESLVLPLHQTHTWERRRDSNPQFKAYETFVLPLHHRAEPHAGFEPASPVWKTGMLPLHQWGIG